MKQKFNNTITFELRDDNGNVIDDTTHTVIPGIQQLILNFDCPVGTNLQLGTSTNNTGLFRNNTGANYPYDIGGALSITESSAGSQVIITIIIIFKLKYLVYFLFPLGIVMVRVIVLILERATDYIVHYRLVNQVV